ncbi:MAG: hydroxymethylbilane synthase [Candidatus Binatia bacterium]
MSERSPSEVLRLGTRGSALAVSQAEAVAAAISARWPDVTVELHRIKTSGDRIQARSLAEIGGKGLFVKEIEEALLEGRIDVGVHSTKDLPARLAPRLGIAAVPRREDARDALIARAAKALGELPPRARVGTGSLRRAAFLRHARPDLEVVPLRGNVDTRIGKWRAGEFDALVLAAAGLRRLGIALAEATPLSAEEMLPAIGQGALAIEAAIGGHWWSCLRELDDPESALAISAERAFLRAMGGDCTTPIAAHATVAGAELLLRAAIGDPEGKRLIRGERAGRREDAESLGGRLGEELLDQGGREVLAGLQR